MLAPDAGLTSPRRRGKGAALSVPVSSFLGAVGQTSCVGSEQTPWADGSPVALSVSEGRVCPGGKRKGSRETVLQRAGDPSPGPGLHSARVSLAELAAHCTGAWRNLHFGGERTPSFLRQTDEWGPSERSSLSSCSVKGSLLLEQASGVSSDQRLLDSWAPWLLVCGSFPANSSASLPAEGPSAHAGQCVEPRGTRPEHALLQTWASSEVSRSELHRARRAVPGFLSHPVPVALVSTDPTGCLRPCHSYSYKAECLQSGFGKPSAYRPLLFKVMVKRC